MCLGVGGTLSGLEFLIFVRMNQTKNVVDYNSSLCVSHGGMVAGFLGLYPDWKHFCLLSSGHYEVGPLGHPKWIGGLVESVEGTEGCRQWIVCSV